jgi:TatD DNase family protein
LWGVLKELGIFMNLVDVHCHLTHKNFEKDLDAVVERAKKAGLKAVVCSGVNPEDNKKVLELSEKYDIVKASLGIYPVDALGLAQDASGLPRHIGEIDLEEQFDFFKKNKDKIVSIGEVGLDYLDRGNDTIPRMMRENFQRIIFFCEKENLPIVVHSRKAEKDCIDMLEASGIKNVVLHCFQGNKKLIKRASDLGYYFSVPCIINKLKHFQMLVEMVDLSKILTETDAPWLSSVVGERNEPKNVKFTVEKIAEIKGLTFEECANIIFMNFQRLFL